MIILWDNHKRYLNLFKVSAWKKTTTSELLFNCCLLASRGKTDKSSDRVTSTVNYRKVTSAESRWLLGLSCSHTSKSIHIKAYNQRHGLCVLSFLYSIYTCAYVLEKFCVDNSLYEGWYGKWQQFIETCSWGPIEQSKVNFLYVFLCQSMWLHDLWPRVLSVTSSKRDEKTSSWGQWSFIFPSLFLFRAFCPSWGEINVLTG